MKLYTLYQTPLGITHYSINYRHGDWVAKVRAKSIKQAYWLLGHQQAASNCHMVGVVSIDNSMGPEAGWPFSMPKTLAPEGWLLT